jgi:hypothetical protein
MLSCDYLKIKTSFTSFTTGIIVEMPAYREGCAASLDTP